MDFGSSEVAVRINLPCTEAALADLQAVFRSTKLPHSIVVPKVDRPSHLEWVCDICLAKRAFRREEEGRVFSRHRSVLFFSKHFDRAEIKCSVLITYPIVSRRLLLFFWNRLCIVSPKVNHLIWNWHLSVVKVYSGKQTQSSTSKINYYGGVIALKEGRTSSKSWMIASDIIGAFSAFWEDRGSEREICSQGCPAYSINHPSLSKSYSSASSSSSSSLSSSLSSSYKYQK